MSSPPEFVELLALLGLVVVAVRWARRARAEPASGGRITFGARVEAAGGDGGIAARKAIVRWAWRLFRREWRQQSLMLALLAVSLAAAVVGIAVAYNAHAADNADFGSANHLLKFDGSDRRLLAANLAATKKWFGTTDLISHRFVSIPGSADGVDLRTENPHGPYAAALLALRQGRYPTDAAELVITDSLSKRLGLHLGSALTIDGHRHRVVGIVENPRRLNEQFALVSPRQAGRPQSVTVLVNSTADAFNRFRQSPRGVAENGKSALIGYQSRPRGQQASALIMFAAASVLLLLVTLVAAAGFAVIAQRRLRQLGMLGAIGATQKHLRLVLLSNGALVGVIGSLIGAPLGVALWIAFAPHLESSVNHRLDPLSVPWGLLFPTILLALFAATAAAWWPGRAAARVPIVNALSTRPPRPTSTHRSALLALVLIAAGAACLAVADRNSPPLIVLGILTTIGGALLLGPAAIGLQAALGRRAPVAIRLALRDLARYQARSGAALAAISLALGIAVAVAVLVAAQADRLAAVPINLSNKQIRVYPDPSAAPDFTPHTTAGDSRRRAAQVNRLASALRPAAIIPLATVAERGAKPELRGTTEGSPSLVATREAGGSYRLAAFLYVATPQLLRSLGIDPTAIRRDTDFIASTTEETRNLLIPSTTTRRVFPITNLQRLAMPRLLLGAPTLETGLQPPILITVNGLRRHGWHQLANGWLVQARTPLTSRKIALARGVAADSGLAIETRRAPDTYAAIRFGTIAAGALLALSILAMTVGLIRSEAAGDLLTLTATGATSRIRRSLTATTAGSLALLGCLLAIPGAYLTLTALYAGDLHNLGRVPLAQLAIIAAGVPTLAGLGGWILAARQPQAARAARQL